VPGLYGQRVRRRLTGEMTTWLTTVGSDGTPQPNRITVGPRSVVVLKNPR
jgi:hypothetical protein